MNGGGRKSPQGELMSTGSADTSRLRSSPPVPRTAATLGGCVTCRRSSSAARFTASVLSDSPRNGVFSLLFAASSYNTWCCCCTGLGCVFCIVLSGQQETSVVIFSPLSPPACWVEGSASVLQFYTKYVAKEVKFFPFCLSHCSESLSRQVLTAV